MLKCFVFLRVVYRSGRKTKQKKKSSSVFYQNGWTTRFLAKKSPQSLGSASSAMLLANRDMDVYVCSLESRDCCTYTLCTSLSDIFHLLLVKCFLKCGVDHTWQRTSTSLNYERFRGHQVKLKQVHFTAKYRNLFSQLARSSRFSCVG